MSSLSVSNIAVTIEFVCDTNMRKIPNTAMAPTVAPSSTVAPLATRDPIIAPSPIEVPPTLAEETAEPTPAGRDAGNDVATAGGVLGETRV